MLIPGASKLARTQGTLTNAGLDIKSLCYVGREQPVKIESQDTLLPAEIPEIHRGREKCNRC